jgi:response regulator of citrate/malate metabolism
VLSDLRLPKGDGMGVLRAVKEVDSELPVIVMTAHGSIQDAVEAMKHGALDFLAKPVDPDHLQLLVSRALEQRRLLTDYRLLKEEAAARRGGPNIIGDSQALRQVMTAIDRRAGTDTTVLLEGESGTGKELCARALTTRARAPTGRSSRSTARRFRRTCSRPSSSATSVAPSPVRHVSGRSASSKWRSAAPSSSTRSARCRWRCKRRCCGRSRPSASSGLGGNTSIQVDVRIVAATNRMLRQAVANRQFREDLYFRLSVFPVTIPPLRERKEDIPKLAHHFVERVARDVGKKLTLGAGSAGDAGRAYVARQRPRAAERDRAGGDSGRRRSPAAAPT